MTIPIIKPMMTIPIMKPMMTIPLLMTPLLMATTTIMVAVVVPITARVITLVMILTAIRHDALACVPSLATFINGLTAMAIPRAVTIARAGD